MHVVPGRLKPETTQPNDPSSYLSWESRYVGSVRAINAGLFDAYLLKSLDGVAAAPDGEGAIITKCGAEGRKRCVFVKQGGDHFVQVGYFSTRDLPAVALAQQLQQVRASCDIAFL